MININFLTPIIKKKKEIMKQRVCIKIKIIRKTIQIVFSNVFYWNMNVPSSEMSSSLVILSEASSVKCQTKYYNKGKQNQSHKPISVNTINY